MARLLGTVRRKLTALVAFYLSAAEIINETHGRSVLPPGAPAGANADDLAGARPA